MDPLRQTGLRVFAIGAIAATLILWLAGSFWLDAWQQRAEGLAVRALSTDETDVLDVSRHLTDERGLMLDAAAARFEGDALRAGRIAARLDDVRRRVDAELDALVPAVRRRLAEPAITRRLRDRPEAIDARLAELSSGRVALDDARAALDRGLVPDADPDAPRASTLPTAALAASSATERVILTLHALQRGLCFESGRTVHRIDGLRRVNGALRDADAALAERTALRRLAAAFGHGGANGSGIETPPLGAATAGDDTSLVSEEMPADLVRALGGATSRLDRASARLDGLARERALPPRVADELALLAATLGDVRTAPDDAGVRPLRRRLARLDGLVRSRIGTLADAIAAHGTRRLVIDTVLIGVCLWIVVGSAGVVRRIRHQVRHDRLTGLPNRFHFEERLCAALASGEDPATRIGLLVIDVDDFKLVNDTYGHPIGDELVGQLAGRLRERLGRDATLARLGGDEFAVALWRTGSADEVHRIAERLQGATETPFEVRGAALSVTLGIGYSLSGETVAHASGLGLLQRASIALRQAKDTGKGRVRHFSHELAERNRERLALEVDLGRGVDAGHLELHYQPKVATRSGRVDGVEALVRWRDPERGLVSPGIFVPIAEASGLIVRIGAWVLDEAVRQTAAWHAAGLGSLKVGVNVAAAQLVADGFTASVERVLERHGLPPDCLELEVTETVGMLDMSLVVERLGRLREIGVRIAIDDFGTDYSSLQYLEDLPLDTLKIDRAFVTRLDDSEKGRSLVNTIVLMAGSFRLETVAEGVETRAQLDKVVALGCDHVQGYYHSRPVPADELPGVIEHLERGRTAEGERRAA